MNRMVKRLAAGALIAALAGLVVLLGAGPLTAGRAHACGVPHADFDVPGEPRVWMEIADEPAERSLGLMHRDYLDPDAGMLFVFEQSGRAAFWMKDTLIPLSIAFIAADGTVVDIQDMEPLSLQPHAPPEDYLYALEVNQGWFAEHEVWPGTTARLCIENDE